MGGMDFHGSVEKEQEDADVIAHNSRWGVILFFVYVLFYGGFMGLSAFYFDLMSRPALFGVNLAVVYGFGLILLAFLLAAIYMAVCRVAKSK